MSTKEEILKMINNMPEDVSIDDVMGKLYVKDKIEKAIKELDEGKGIPHEQVKEKIQNSMQQ